MEVAWAHSQLCGSWLWIRGDTGTGLSHQRPGCQGWPKRWGVLRPWGYKPHQVLSLWPDGSLSEEAAWSQEVELDPYLQTRRRALSPWTLMPSLRADSQDWAVLGRPIHLIFA